MKTKGVFLVAFWKRGYGIAAFNLCCSIKHRNPNIQITLLTDGEAISQTNEIDRVVDNIIIHDQPIHSPGEFKISVYDKLPYDYNLYLDVDAYASKDLMPLIDKLAEDYENDSSKYYRTYVHEWYDKDSPDVLPQMFWAKKSTIWNQYGFINERLPATQSSIQFVVKCEKSKQFFESLQNTMNNNPIPLDELTNIWGDSQPDELYLNVTIAQKGITPDIDHSCMVFANNKHLTWTHAKAGFYLISFFGTKRQLRDTYFEAYNKEVVGHKKALGLNPKGMEMETIMQDKHANKGIGKKPVPKRPEPKTQIQVIKKKYATHLYTSYFDSKNQDRNNEMLRCLNGNLNNPFIDKVIVLTEVPLFVSHEKLTVIDFKRPTYNDFFEIINSGTDLETINIISNSDIFFNDSLSSISAINFDNHVVVLSRYDYKSGKIKLFDEACSQDAWMWQGKMKPVDGNYYLGKPGCDNRIAFEFDKAGYKLSNPSKSIQAIHLHTVDIRSYTQADRIVGDYLHVAPSVLDVNTLLIIQPGKVGDIIRVLPIAKWYSDLGYIVFWKCPKMYHNLFDYVDYVTPVESDGDYTKTIDLSFGIDTNAPIHQSWLKRRKDIDSWIRYKYELAEVPLTEFSNLQYIRNHQKEKELYELVTKNVEGDYKLVHRISDYGSGIDVHGNCIFFEPVGGYTIFDWRLVIENATEIHCIVSSLLNYIDSLPEVKGELFHYITERVAANFDRVLTVKNWNVINRVDKIEV